jgi:DNA-binding LytR/AlgR family response regulator
MKCLIIEDEPHAADYLETQLVESGYEVDVMGKIDTIEDSVSWLRSNKADLIFMDIQLGDGLSFEIFDHVQIKTPIIFTTSYDQYVIKSFEQNSLAYLLKPIKQIDLSIALEKFRLLYPEGESLNERLVPLREIGNYQSRFLIKTGSIFRSIRVEDVAYFHLQNKRFLFIVTHQNEQFLYDSTMEMLEKRLDPEQFFRINRQFTVSHASITQMQLQERGRFKIETRPECKEEMIVSINKIADFRNWLNR